MYTSVQFYFCVIQVETRRVNLDSSDLFYEGTTVYYMEIFQMGLWRVFVLQKYSIKNI